MKRTLILIGFSLLLLNGCTMFSDDATAPRKRVKVSCADARLNSSFKFHDRAKNYLGSYYKTRKESELFFAWYAAEDSVYMAKTIGRCWDKKNKHYHAVQNIFRKNSILRKLVSQNMRQDSQTQISELFLDDYRKIFVRDIQ